MPKLTWLGEDHLEYQENEQPPSYNTWNKIKFPKGVPVELNGKVKDKAQMEYMLRKASSDFWEITPDSEPDTPINLDTAFDTHKRGPGRPRKMTDGINNE